MEMLRYIPLHLRSCNMAAAGEHTQISILPYTEIFNFEIQIHSKRKLTFETCMHACMLCACIKYMPVIVLHINVFQKKKAKKKK